MGIVLAFLLGMPILALPQVQSLFLSPVRSERSEVTSAIDRQPRANTFASAPPHPVLNAQPSVAETAAAPRHDPAAMDIEALQARLIELDAEQMALERVGVNQSRYRFTCNLPVRPGSAYKRRFQIVDADPAEAMRRVVAEVERWRVATSANQLGRPTVRLR